MAGPSPSTGEHRSDDGADARTDLELVDAVNGGDASAFDALYERHHSWAAGLAFRFTGDREVALDVAQEAFIYLLRKFPGFVLTAKMTTFLYPVVRNLAITIKRRERRYVGADEGLLELHAPAQRREDLEALDGAIRSLPVRQQEVVLMRFVDDMSMQEIGVALEIPTGTVKSRLHHAIRALRADARTAAAFGLEGKGPGGHEAGEGGGGGGGVVGERPGRSDEGPPGATDST